MKQFEGSYMKKWINKYGAFQTGRQITGEKVPRNSFILYTHITQYDKFLVNLKCQVINIVKHGKRICHVVFFGNYQNIR